MNMRLYRKHVICPLLMLAKKQQLQS